MNTKLILAGLTALLVSACGTATATHSTTAHHAAVSRPESISAWYQQYGDHEFSVISSDDTQISDDLGASNYMGADIIAAELNAMTTEIWLEHLPPVNPAAYRAMLQNQAAGDTALINGNYILASSDIDTANADLQSWENSAGLNV